MQIVILNRESQCPVSSCSGPTAVGLCPRRTADGHIPCAGLDALTRSADGTIREWHIPADADECFVQALGQGANFR